LRVTENGYNPGASMFPGRRQIVSFRLAILVLTMRIPFQFFIRKSAIGALPGWCAASLLLILVALHTTFAARVGIAVFPLKNETGTAAFDWIGAGSAETMFRKLRMLEGIQVWDPAFLFQADSSGWEMKSDTLAMQHRLRWQWDVAVGGGYRVKDDRIEAEFRLFWSTGSDELLTVSLPLAESSSRFFPLIDNAIMKMLAVIHYRLSPADSLAVRNDPACDSASYRTYAAGYGYEMRSNPDAAITAYARAAEIDPGFAAPACREGGLFRRANDSVHAREVFEGAMAHASVDEYIVAAYADYLVEREKTGAALKFIEENRGLLEKTATGLTAMGKIYIANGDYQRGIATLARAAASGPNDLDPAFALAQACSMAGDIAQASDILNSLIRFRPDYPRYYAALGEACRRAGWLTESAAILDAGSAIAPGNPEVLLSAVYTYVKLGWYARAEQIVREVREASPRLPSTEVFLGVVYWYEDREADAVRCFETASRVESTRGAALNNLGDLQLFEGSPSRAIQAYLKADKSGVENEVILGNLAEAYRLEHKPGKAAACYDRLLRRQPDRIDILMRQSNIAVELGHDEDASRYYHRVIELDPGNETAIRGLVQVLIRQNRYSDALGPVENYLAHSPLSREFMNLNALIYLKMGSYAQALLHYRTLLRAFPGDSGGLLGVGQSMYGLIKYKGHRDYDNAIFALKLAEKSAPDSPVPLLLMGDIYADYKGYGELAVDCWKKALALTHDSETRKSLELKIAGSQ
jgi:tetratricopeptide (TPR) repeat protein